MKDYGRFLGPIVMSLGLIIEGCVPAGELPVTPSSSTPGPPTGSPGEFGPSLPTPIPGTDAQCNFKQENERVYIGSTTYSIENASLRNSAEFISLLCQSHYVLKDIWETEPLNSQEKPGMAVKISIDPNLPAGAGGYTDYVNYMRGEINIVLKSWKGNDDREKMVLAQELSHAFGPNQQQSGYLGMMAETHLDSLNDILTIKAGNQLGNDWKQYFAFIDETKFDLTTLPGAIFAEPSQEAQANRWLVIGYAHNRWQELLTIFKDFPKYLKQRGFQLQRQAPKTANFPWQTIAEAASLAGADKVNQSALQSWLNLCRSTMWNFPAAPTVYVVLEPYGNEICLGAFRLFGDSQGAKYLPLGEQNVTTQVSVVINRSTQKTLPETMLIVPGQHLTCIQGAANMTGLQITKVVFLQAGKPISIRDQIITGAVGIKRK